MQERPTKDLVAYDFYVQATSLIDKAAHESGKEQGKDYFQAIELLNQAIARDSAFLLAYCRLAEANDELYFNGFDHTPSRLELAKSAINSAFRLKPDSGEAHLALAAHFYHGYFDYDRARDELAIALRTCPTMHESLNGVDTSTVVRAVGVMPCAISSVQWSWIRETYKLLTPAQ